MEFTEEQTNDNYWRVRYWVAANPNTPVGVLEALSKDDYEDVRWEVAQNPNTPMGVSEVLAEDEDEDVRRGVSRNPNSAAQILVRGFEYERRQKKPSRGILKAIVKNSNCPDYLKAVIQTVLEGME
jgi:hypothetical protein